MGNRSNTERPFKAIFLLRRLAIDPRPTLPPTADDAKAFARAISGADEIVIAMTNRKLYLAFDIALTIKESGVGGVSMAAAGYGRNYSALLGERVRRELKKAARS